LGGTLGWFGEVNVWTLIWPAFLVILGLWLLVRPSHYWRNYDKHDWQAQQVSYPLENASQAEIELDHGAGRITVASGTDPATLLSGTFVGGVDPRLDRDGSLVLLRLRSAVENMWDFPDHAPHGLEWNMHLNNTVPMTLDVKTGASENFLDLSDLKVTDLKVETGASSTRITLPANVAYTKAKIDAGAASVTIKVPENVAARIHVSSAIASKRIDTVRFPANGNFYETPGYDAAANKAEIIIETGVGSVEVN
ncbi:MAG TPA: hypothetical protein VMC62_09790, partial [Longilinea sp.]|nr:hypothetical protein [Longilinea sp.]